jgi:membrane protease YdiL (CAAX protease family)
MTTWPAVAHLTVFVAGCVVWVAALGVLAALVLVSQGLSPEHVGDLGGGALGAMAILQSVGMAALAAGLGSRLPSADGPRWQAVFPLGADGRWLGVGLLAGLTVWTFPSWVADQLSAWVDPATLEMIARGLSTGPWVERAILAVAVAGSAPIFEELVFRGYVWRVFELAAGRRGAFLGSTALFCAYHLDPVQSVALVPTALVLGWLRLRSGSLAPAIGAHFVNNALGVALAGVSEPVPAWFGLLGAALTAAILAGGERFARPISR